MARKVRTEEEIFLDKLKKMEKFKEETDQKLIKLGRQFFKEYNSISYKTIHKRIEEKYKSNPFERRKCLTEQQEKLLYEKFNTSDLDKIIDTILESDLGQSVSLENKEEISNETIQQKNKPINFSKRRELY